MLEKGIEPVITMSCFVKKSLYLNCSYFPDVVNVFVELTINWIQHLKLFWSRPENLNKYSELDDILLDIYEEEKEEEIKTTLAL